MNQKRLIHRFGSQLIGDQLKIAAEIKIHTLTILEYPDYRTIAATRLKYCSLSNLETFASGPVTWYNKNKTFPSKMIKIIACHVMKEELLAVKRDQSAPEIEWQFVSMGLHLHPAKLHRELQKLLDQSQKYSRIILGFGLCGGAANQLRAPGCWLTIPRVHDCIPVLLGAISQYRQLNNETSGTFYLSGGWIEGEHSLLNEYRRICQKYGPAKALRVLHQMFANYHQLTYISTDHPREEANRTESQNLAQLLNLNLTIRKGSPRYFEKIVNGPWDDAGFINIAPGKTITEQDFL
jgi:hypothetical protein